MVTIRSSRVREGPGTDAWPGGLDHFCTELVARVEARRDEMVTTIAKAVRPFVPSELLDSVEWGVGEALEILLASLRDGRDLDRDELARLQELSVLWERVGASLDAWRATISAAHDAAYDYLLGQARALGDELGDGVDLDLVAQVLALHTRRLEARQWEAIAAGLAEGAAASAPSDPLERWLSGEVGNDASIPDGPWALLVALEARPQGGGTGQTTDLQAGARALAAQLPGAEVGVVRPTPCPHVVVAAPLGEDPWARLLGRLARVATDSGLVVVAEPAAGPAALGEVYRWVQRRLEAAGAMGRPEVVRASDLALAFAAGLVDPAERFWDVQRILGPVLARREDYARKDLETLTAFVECGGEVKAVAARLGISVRQIRRRLEGIEQRTGLRLSDPRDMVRLTWALHLYSTTGDMPPPCDLAWVGGTPAGPRADQGPSGSPNRKT